MIWYKPNITKDSIQLTWTRSCWNCQHLEVSSFPQRQCGVKRKQHIWSCSPEDERRENGKVVAEECIVIFQCNYISASSNKLVLRSDPEPARCSSKGQYGSQKMTTRTQ